jgi:NSS family neurotransmitter:Na+ symporter
MQKTLKSHGTWIGKWTFVLAATGSAVGLGNIWGFPYKAGTEGGGAFVLLYLLCILLIGLPVMVSEILIGRRSGTSPINSMKKAAIESNRSSSWQLVGWIGIIAGVLILSFYSVIAGLCLNYIFLSAASSGAVDAQTQFGTVTQSWEGLLLWHSIFMILTLLVVSAGIKSGIERMVKILMPMLGFLLIFMVISSAINGDFNKAIEFLFAPDFDQVNSQTFLSAMGQAFFSLSLGMGSIMAYGAYMPKDENIVSTSFSVGSLDTLVAILAGLAIFPIIFAFNMEPNSGPGLVFISILTAFNQMEFGNFLGPIFFILLTIAALSSSISLLEPSVAYFAEKQILSRKSSAIAISLFAWTLGIGSALSFNLLSDFYIYDRNFLDFMDFIANQILLPLGGMLIAIFVGWFIPDNLIKEETGDFALFKVWKFFIKFVAPTAVFIIFVSQFI